MTKQPRCYAHRDRERFPAGCPVCHRIMIESRIVRRTVRALLDAGYAVFVDGQGDDNRPAVPTRDYATIKAELMETDDDYLAVFTPEQARAVDGSRQRNEGYGWVRFVYGNDGYDVISDYTTNLEPIIAPIMKYADTLA